VKLVFIVLTNIEVADPNQVFWNKSSSSVSSSKSRH